MLAAMVKQTIFYTGSFTEPLRLGKKMFCNAPHASHIATKPEVW